jgi:hypothetical protein
LFVRCKDANGNENLGEFEIKYCVDNTPDKTAAEIIGTSLTAETPIPFMTENEFKKAIELYIAEPVTGCKWSFSDQSYDSMPTALDCTNAKSISNMNSNLLYTCKTTLVGAKNKATTNYYFRCNDSVGNINQESYKFKFVGTEPLSIDSATPNNTLIKTAGEIAEVELKMTTSAGYKSGEATCYYANNAKLDGRVAFETTTGTYSHVQKLNLGNGSYNIYLQCVDLAGNSANTFLNFSIEADNSKPIVVRAYNQAENLNILTNENSECVYDTVSCNYVFTDGKKMTNSDGKEYSTGHYTEWDTKKSYYIKCSDEYGNHPAQSDCSIAVKPFESTTE